MLEQQAELKLHRFHGERRANHLFVLSLIILYICGKFWFNKREKKGFNKRV